MGNRYEKTLVSIGSIVTFDLARMILGQGAEEDPRLGRKIWELRERETKLDNATGPAELAGYPLSQQLFLKREYLPPSFSAGLTKGILSETSFSSCGAEKASTFTQLLHPAEATWQIDQFLNEWISLHGEVFTGNPNRWKGHWLRSSGSMLGCKFRSVRYLSVEVN